MSLSGPGIDDNEGILRIPKSPALLELRHYIVYCYIQELVEVGSYPYTEMQSMYSTTDWAT